MIRLKTNQKGSYKDLLYKLAIFVATVGVMAYFMPREGKFNYQYDINKPWRYGLLTAPYDFPIYKNESVIKKEQDSLMSFYQPYFNYNSSIADSALQRLTNDYHKKLSSRISLSYYLYLKNILQNVYKRGIISPDDYLRLTANHIKGIMIAQKQSAKSVPITSPYTIKNAYEYILGADTIHFDQGILQSCNLDQYIMPNLSYDEHKSAMAKKDLISSVAIATGLVQSGQRIIDRGEIISKDKYNILESMKKESGKRSDSQNQLQTIFWGQVLFVGMLILLFMTYLELFRKDYFKTRKNFLLLFSIMILYVLMAELMVRYNFFNVYIIPFAMLPMVIRIFLDSRTAFISHVIVMIICSIFLRYPYEFLLLQITAGLVGIYSLRELSRRSQLFRSAFLITASYATINFSLDLMHENEISKINLNMYVNFLINGGFLLLTYPLLALFEKGFGFISNVTLVELSDTNNKLLRQLSEEAPGTFQHCINVGNLAAAAADQIGAKNQLIRTGALYHDIGKMKNAVFFTENQNGVNPHKSLSYEQSAQIVISHVNDGLRLAEKHNLPKQIKDFISTHHGKGQAKYFLVSWMNEHPNDKPDLSKFTYPGPNPFTKETALLMMADSVEATSRSLKEYTEENINDIVDKIIDGQMAAGYFKECPITFKDISTVKAVFKEKLRTMYHTRISYPQLKQQSDQEQASESNNSKTK